MLPIPLPGEIISFLSEGHRHLVFRAVLALCWPFHLPSTQGSGNLAFEKALWSPCLG